MQNVQFMVNLFNMFHGAFNLLKLFLHSTEYLALHEYWVIYERAFYGFLIWNSFVFYGTILKNQSSTMTRFFCPNKILLSVTPVSMTASFIKYYGKPPAHFAFPPPHREAGLHPLPHLPFNNIDHYPGSTWDLVLIRLPK